MLDVGAALHHTMCSPRLLAECPSMKVNRIHCGKHFQRTFSIGNNVIKPLFLFVLFLIRNTRERMFLILFSLCSSMRPGPREQLKIKERLGVQSDQQSRSLSYLQVD